MKTLLSATFAQFKATFDSNTAAAAKTRPTLSVMEGIEQMAVQPVCFK